MSNQLVPKSVQSRQLTCSISFRASCFPPRIIICFKLYRKLYRCNLVCSFQDFKIFLILFFLKFRLYKTLVCIRPMVHYSLAYTFTFQFKIKLNNSKHNLLKMCDIFTELRFNCHMDTKLVMYLFLSKKKEKQKQIFYKINLSMLSKLLILKQNLP